MPFQFPPPVLVDASTTALAPECLRDVTLPYAGGFQGAASFPPPFGQGWTINPNPCQ